MRAQYPDQSGQTYQAVGGTPGDQSTPAAQKQKTDELGGDQECQVIVGKESQSIDKH